MSSVRCSTRVGTWIDGSDVADVDARMPSRTNATARRGLTQRFVRGAPTHVASPPGRTALLGARQTRLAVPHRELTGEDLLRGVPRMSSRVSCPSRPIRPRGSRVTSPPTKIERRRRARDGSPRRPVASGAPSLTARDRTARSEPAASITARTSSMRSSSVGTITADRIREARCRACRRGSAARTTASRSQETGGSAGRSQYVSRCETQPMTKTRSTRARRRAPGRRC